MDSGVTLVGVVYFKSYRFSWLHYMYRYDCRGWYQCRATGSAGQNNYYLLCLYRIRFLLPCWTGVVLVLQISLQEPRRYSNKDHSLMSEPWEASTYLNASLWPRLFSWIVQLPVGFSRVRSPLPPVSVIPITRDKGWYYQNYKSTSSSWLRSLLPRDSPTSASWPVGWRLTSLLRRWYQIL